MLKEILEDWINRLDPPLMLCIDISGMPRKVIISFLKVIDEINILNSTSKFMVFYTWPKKYPKYGRPANVGALTMDEGVDLTRFISNSTVVKSILIPGREGYSSSLFIDTLPPNAETTTFAYWAKENALFSLDMLYANSALISEIKNSSNNSLHYFLSIPRGHDLILEHTTQLIQSRAVNKSNNVFVIAPFGAKPLLITSFIAEKCAKKNGWKSELVVWSSHQYSDLYSLGVDHISIYEVTLKFD